MGFDSASRSAGLLLPCRGSESSPSTRSSTEPAGPGPSSPRSHCGPSQPTAGSAIVTVAAHGIATAAMSAAIMKAILRRTPRTRSRGLASQARMPDIHPVRRSARRRSGKLRIERRRPGRVNKRRSAIVERRRSRRFAGQTPRRFPELCSGRSLLIRRHQRHIDVELHVRQCHMDAADALRPSLSNRSTTRYVATGWAMPLTSM